MPVAYIANARRGLTTGSTSRRIDKKGTTKMTDDLYWAEYDGIHAFVDSDESGIIYSNDASQEAIDQAYADFVVGMDATDGEVIF